MIYRNNGSGRIISVSVLRTIKKTAKNYISHLPIVVDADKTTTVISDATTEVREIDNIVFDMF